MEMEKSGLPATTPETARIYLRALGPFGSPGGGNSLPQLLGTSWRVAAWEVAIRTGRTIERRIATTTALHGWLQQQPAAIGARLDLQFHRITTARDSDTTAAVPLPLRLGIVNVTPDSFSDGGQHADPAVAITHGRRLAAAGAQILDIGGESTRPGATPVPPDEEIERVLPVIRGLQDLRHATEKVALSIDTRHAAVMRAALEAGVDIINDVSALTGDSESLAVAASGTSDIVLMHMQGEPLTMNRSPAYEDVALDVFDYLEQRIETCIAAGIERRRLIVDPGIGFGKRSAENLAILRNLALFHGLGCRTLLGASRKGFGSETQALAPEVRLPTSLAVAAIAAAQGFDWLRVHDVAETRQALQIWRRIAENPTAQVAS